MLTGLSIRDVVLIDRLDLEFGPGLTVLTGETGAGKSILLDSLGLAMGARAEAGLVRKGAEQASVTAMFSPAPGHPAYALLAEQGVEPGEEIVLRRVLAVDGRSRAFANDIPVGAALLRRVAGLLVEVQGQHDQMGLADPAMHVGLLDSYAVPPALKRDIGAAFRGWRDALARLEAARAAIAEAERDQDWLRHAVDELSRLAPLEGEENSLAAERQRLQQGEKRAEAIAAALAELVSRDRRNPGPGAALRAASRALTRLAPVRRSAGGKPRRPRYRCPRTRRGGAGRGGNPAATARPGQRGRSAPAGGGRGTAVRPARRRPQAQCGRRRTAGAAGSRCAPASLRWRPAPPRSMRWSATAPPPAPPMPRSAPGCPRRAAPPRRSWTAPWRSELPPLRLERARFVTDVAPLPEAAWGPLGADAVRFLIATNPGQEPGPLAKIASGGELSRLMLALKVVLAGGSPVPTLVFDEVDSGIGGATAAAVGERLARVAERVQVLLVTHSPQVAARGAAHLRVAKQTAKGRARDPRRAAGRRRTGARRSPACWPARP